MFFPQGVIGQEEAGDVGRRPGQDKGRRDRGAHRGPTAEDQVAGETETETDRNIVYKYRDRVIDRETK